MKCTDCGEALAGDRELGKCNSCHALQIEKWRAAMHSGPTRDFPGVDIDRIHHQRGARARKAA